MFQRSTCVGAYLVRWMPRGVCKELWAAEGHSPILLRVACQLLPTKVDFRVRKVQPGLEVRDAHLRFLSILVQVQMFRDSKWLNKLSIWTQNITMPIRSIRFQTRKKDLMNSLTTTQTWNCPKSAQRTLKRLIKRIKHSKVVQEAFSPLTTAKQVESKVPLQAASRWA